MPGLRQVLLVAMIITAAPSAPSQTPQKVDTVYVRDTVVVQDTDALKHTTYLLDSSSTVQKEVAELKGEFYEKALDALDRQDSSMGIVFGVIGLLLLIVGAMGAYTSFTAYKAHETVDREIEKIRDQRAVMDKIVQSAQTDYGQLARQMKEADSSARVADAVAPASSDTKKPEPFEDRIKLIEEADATKAVDLYERLRFDLKVAGLPDDIIPSALRRNMGLNYYRLERFEKALGELLHILKDSQDDEDVLFATAHSYSELQKNEEAVKYWERVTDINSMNAAAFANWAASLASIFRATGEPSTLNDAIRNSTLAIRLAPDRKDYQYNVACAMALKGNKDRALAALKEAFVYNAKLKKAAKKDEDFKAYWNDSDFIALTAEDPPKDEGENA